MSSSRVIIRQLTWSEMIEIVSYLSFIDIIQCGLVSRSGYINIFQREVQIRSNPKLKINSRFLSAGLDQEKILLVSYPRSGNSFLRRLIEDITGIITGSDSRPNRTLSASLLRCGFRGEGIVDTSVWVVKSHYPERMGYLKFRCHRILLLCRNPFDSLESYFNMGMTNTHDKALSVEAFNNLQEIWKEFIPNEASIWAEFHKYWFNKCETEHLPLHVVRYEDLLGDGKDAALSNIVSFMHAGGRAPKGWSRFSPSRRLHTEIKSSAETAHRMNGELSASSLPFSGPGYSKKEGAVGKTLCKMSCYDADAVARTASSVMVKLGYHLTSIRPTSSAVAADPAFTSASECLKLIVHELPASTRAYSTKSLDQSNRSDGRPYMFVNETFSIRPDSDRFGRYFTELRRSLTADDSKPFTTKT